jgi:DNA (cytosine-5)-methyltransferase 1
MRYGSVCSGIEAATVAWEPLGWDAAFFAETNRFCNAVLAHHYPEVENLGDFTKITEEHGPVDILVGGTPCQSFSSAGPRTGLRDPRGNLALEYCLLATRLQARWVVWENVAGILSSEEGRDLGTFLGALAECGYGFCYRILDAQFFGVPQRRRRIFVVGYLGDWRPPAAVLLEPESLRGDLAPSREEGKDTSGCLTRSAGIRGPDERDASRLVPHRTKSLAAHGPTLGSGGIGIGRWIPR